MSNYQLTVQAQQDLVQIRRYTKEHWGAKQSADYLNDLRKTLQLLSEMPLMGRNCSDDLGKNIYKFLFGSYAIYYFVMAESIIVIAIFLQSMIPANHLENRL